MHTTTNTPTPTSAVESSIHPAPHRPDPDVVLRLLAKRSYCTLATVSPAGRPHVAGVLYELSGRRMYISALASSRKARNVEIDSPVGVVVPIRRVPIGGPPSAVQFQSTATRLATNDAEITERVAAGSLRSITSHGELDLPDGCFLRVDLPLRLHTYGLGMSLWSLVRDPLGAAGIVELRPASD